MSSFQQKELNCIVFKKRTREESTSKRIASKKRNIEESTPKRMPSNVWNWFERKEVDKRMKAECIFCHKHLRGDSKAGTSHLRRHLKSCKKCPFNIVIAEFQTSSTNQITTVCADAVGQEILLLGKKKFKLSAGPISRNMRSATIIRDQRKDDVALNKLTLINKEKQPMIPSLLTSVLGLGEIFLKSASPRRLGPQELLWESLIELKDLKEELQLFSVWKESPATSVQLSIPVEAVQINNEVLILIPSWLSRLKSLKTPTITPCCVLRIPDFAGTLSNLRYLCVINMSPLERCQSLTSAGFDRFQNTLFSAPKICPRPIIFQPERFSKPTYSGPERCLSPIYSDDEFNMCPNICKPVDSSDDYNEDEEYISPLWSF